MIVFFFCQFVIIKIPIKRKDSKSKKERAQVQDQGTERVCTVKDKVRGR